LDASFIPPAFIRPRRAPGLIRVLRSIRSPVEAWPPEAFEGGVHRIPFPGAPLVISDPDLAGEVLVHRREDFPRGELVNRLFRPVWGRGIFVSEGADWHWQRRAAAPAFRADAMARLVPIVHAAAADALTAMPEGQPVDLTGQSRRLALRVLFDACFSSGADLLEPDEVDPRFSAFIDGVAKFTLLDALPALADWRGPVDARGGAARAWLRERLGALVAQRRSDGRASGDLVDLLIDARPSAEGEGMDDERVCDNLLGFLAAGRETTSHALAWALWLTARHPPTERRLLDEVDAVAGEGPIGSDHLDRLGFARQVIQETMRLYPGAIALARTAAQEVAIGGHRVRSGQLVLIAVYALHRRPDLWPDPDVFEPDRFAPGSEGVRTPFAYLPFGAGPRACMGGAFAMTEMTTALATLVRGAHFAAATGRPVRVGARMGAAIARHGLWAVPHARTRL
jgi:cytochrome P450